MSLEAFSPIDFPALPDGRGDDRAEMRGHAAGYAAGRKQVERELEALKQVIAEDGHREVERLRSEVQLALDALARSAEEYRRRELPMLTSLDTAIASAAMELAEVIVGHELSEAEDSARAAMERAVQEGGETVSSIRMHPEDIAIVSAEATARPAIQLVPDPSLRRGDAMVDVADGLIDARVSASLARARAALQWEES